MARRTSPAKELLHSDALLLRRVAYGEADDIVLLFTADAGALSAIARGSRRGSKRFAGLEPMHTLRVGVDISPGRDLGTLKDASIARVRAGLVGDLASMEAAGAALRWVRRGTAPRTAEPAVWQAISALLDALDARDGDALQQLAAFGVQLLAAAGWGLELEACVRCGKPCPERARTAVDAGAGGVVCRPCGATGTVVSARERRAMIAAATGGRFTAPPERAIAIVESALEIHGRGEGT